MNAQEVLARFKIGRELLEAAGVRHTNDYEVRELLGIHGRPGQDLSGIVFPYRDPRDGARTRHRVRFDTVLADGQKYLSEQGCRDLYFPPNCKKALADTSIPIVIVESEKSVLALTALAHRHGRKLLIIAIGGVWGFLRKSGTELQPDGTRQPVSGPSPSLDLVVWKNRKTILCLDSNVAGRRDLQKARLKLAEELTKRDAQILIASVPRRNGVNGPDDLIAELGDEAALEMLARAAQFGRARVMACGTRDVLLEQIRNGPNWKPTAETPGPQAGAVLRCFSDIASEPLRWLWPGRIPLGKLALLIGDPGLGKSLLTVDVVSRLTRGTSFPDGAACELGSAIFLSAEDDAADTIRPRLDAAGADVSRVHILEAVRVQLTNGSLTEKAFNLETDIAALEGALQEHPEVRLIVIDPVSAYLGGVDSHSNAEVRGMLAPLAALAARFGVAVLCITHLRKSAGAAVYRAIASIAFTAAARAVWAVAPDPEDGDRRLLLAVKQNLSADAGGLAFRIEAQNNVPRLAWEPGAVALAANEVLGVEMQQDQNERREAKEWLKDFLAHGPVAVKKIQQQAKAAGLSWMAVRRAKDKLPVVPGKDGYQGPWEWRLEDAQPQRCSPYRDKVSAFEQVIENTKLNGNGAAKDAHSTEVSTFDAFEDDGEVRL